MLKKQYAIPENMKVVLHVGHLKTGRNIEILENVKKITAISIIAAHHAAEMRRKQFAKGGITAKMSASTEKHLNKIKEIVPDFNEKDFLVIDRFLYNDIQTILNNYEEFAALAEGLI